MQVLHIKGAKNTKKKKRKRKVKNIKSRKNSKSNARENKVVALHLHDHQVAQAQVQAALSAKEAGQRKAVDANSTATETQVTENHTNNQNFTKII